jgi:hypothetical protein
LTNQVLQLVSFSILGYTYQYAAGIYLIVGIDLTEGFSLITKFGLSTWRFVINGDRESLLLNFNLVAVGLIILLKKLEGNLKGKRWINRSMQLGRKVSHQEFKMNKISDLIKYMSHRPYALPQGRWQYYLMLGMPELSHYWKEHSF